MKLSSQMSPRGRASQGFTLLELMIVITVIAILAGLTLQAFTYAQQSSARNRTLAALTQIKSSLEQYKEKYGEYPAPTQAAQSVTTNLGGLQNVNYGTAKMLYQAITGDGNDALNLPQGSASTPSTGNPTVTDIQSGITQNLPKTMILAFSIGQANTYILVDGFSHPFQYQKAAVDGNGNATTINPNYDLWSYAQSTTAGTTDLTNVQTKMQNSNSWIKNW